MSSSSCLLLNARLVNRNQVVESDVWIRNGRIERIGPSLDVNADRVMDLQGLYVLPGIIDDQVHFREPGLTHKATIGSESRAAVAGGVTSFMEMPNVQPPSVTQERLEEKYQIAARHSPANFSFYMGATNDNLEEVLRTDLKRVCGVKVFMGSSTGNMLVDNPSVLERLFAESNALIATHCEDEATIRHNLELFRARYGDAGLLPEHHPLIRNEEACLLSSSLAIDLARRHGTRLHILHITTSEECRLFDNSRALAEKRITAEVCVHHLWFDSGDYQQLGNRIKCNPAIKDQRHRDTLFQAMLDDRIDVVATDHAPHTADEKAQPYLQAPSGLPLVQHALPMMLRFYHDGLLSLEKIAEKMAHAPAIAFRIKDRGFIDEGCWADLAVVDPLEEWTVAPDNLLYRCGWSPLEGVTFRGKVKSTFVNGHLAWHDDKPGDFLPGQRLEFDR